MPPSWECDEAVKQKVRNYAAMLGRLYDHMFPASIKEGPNLRDGTCAVKRKHAGYCVGWNSPSGHISLTHFAELWAREGCSVAHISAENAESAHRLTKALFLGGVSSNDDSHRGSMSPTTAVTVGRLRQFFSYVSNLEQHDQRIKNAKFWDDDTAKPRRKNEDRLLAHSAFHFADATLLAIQKCEKEDVDVTFTQLVNETNAVVGVEIKEVVSGGDGDTVVKCPLRPVLHTWWRSRSIEEAQETGECASFFSKTWDTATGTFVEEDMLSSDVRVPSSWRALAARWLRVVAVPAAREEEAAENDLAAQATALEAAGVPAVLVDATDGMQPAETEQVDYEPCDDNENGGADNVATDPEP